MRVGQEVIATLGSPTKGRVLKVEAGMATVLWDTARFGHWTYDKQVTTIQAGLLLPVAKE